MYNVYSVYSVYSVYNVIRWHRSKDRVQKPYSDFTSYMMNKKWWLEEEFNLHMMRFQQVKSRYLLIIQFDIFNSRLV